MRLAFLFLSFFLSICLASEIPPFWQKTCPFSELPVEGSEGTLNSTLRGVLVLFRHGERSGLSHSDENGCLPYLKEDIEQFEEYANVVESEEFRKFLKVKDGDRYFWLPERSRCASGQLTAEGALQHHRLGKFLKSRYESLLDTSPEITAITTHFNRTLQSAIGLISGFLYPSEDASRNVEIQVINNTIMCASSGCFCPNLDKVWWKHAFDEEYEVYKEMAPPEIREIVGKLTKIPVFKGKDDPYHLLDKAFSRVICRRRPMPCFNGTCASYDDFDKLINFTTLRGDYWFNHKEKYMRFKADHVKAHSILSHLVQDVSKLQKNGENRFIKLLSAHDVTVAAVLRVLSVPFIDPPRYASRIVFEVYEDLHNEGYGIRMIYNGDDVTKQVEFCEMSPCGAEKFEEFLPVILKRLPKDNLTELCNQ